MDNVFVERLWRSVKYEDVYLRAYETPTELRAGLARYFGFYNTRRRHSALERRTPDAVYFATRLTAIWQPETRGRLHLPHCPVLGVQFSTPRVSSTRLLVMLRTTNKRLFTIESVCSSTYTETAIT